MITLLGYLTRVTPFFLELVGLVMLLGNSNPGVAGLLFFLGELFIFLRFLDAGKEEHQLRDTLATKSGQLQYRSRLSLNRRKNAAKSLRPYAFRTLNGAFFSAGLKLACYSAWLSVTSSPEDPAKLQFALLFAVACAGISVGFLSLWLANGIYCFHSRRVLDEGENRNFTVLAFVAIPLAFCTLGRLFFPGAPFLGWLQLWPPLLSALLVIFVKVAIFFNPCTLVRGEKLQASAVAVTQLLLAVLVSQAYGLIPSLPLSAFGN